jgi:hypothetical protein
MHIICFWCCCCAVVQLATPVSPSHDQADATPQITFHLYLQEIWVAAAGAISETAVMQCILDAYQQPHSSSSTSSRGCKHNVNNHRQNVVHVPSRAVVRKDAYRAAGGATGSSTTIVVPAQKQKQHLQHNTPGTQRTSPQPSSSNQTRKGNNGRDAKQKHAGKHSASNSSSTRHLPQLQALQQLLVERPAPERPALLTAAIKACSSWQQAALLFADHSHEFNAVHTAALISHLPKVSAAAARACAGGWDVAAITI